MPIIFAQAIMFAPGALARKFPVLSELQDPFGLWYNVIFALLIVIFSFFYTAITIPTNKMADDLKKSGGFILPAIVVQFGVQQGWALFYGGTSLIIMVGVAIDTIQQINSYLLNSLVKQSL